MKVWRHKVTGQEWAVGERRFAVVPNAAGGCICAADMIALGYELIEKEPVVFEAEVERADSHWGKLGDCALVPFIGRRVKVTVEEI